MRRGSLRVGGGDGRVELSPRERGGGRVVRVRRLFLTSEDGKEAAEGVGVAIGGVAARAQRPGGLAGAVSVVMRHGGLSGDVEWSWLIVPACSAVKGLGSRTVVDISE